MPQARPQRHREHDNREHDRNVQPGEFAENITTRGLDLSSVMLLDRFEAGGAELEVQRKPVEAPGRAKQYVYALLQPEILTGIDAEKSAGKTESAKVVVAQLRDMGRVVVGAKLTGAARALEIKLDADALAKLDEIWPGYKTAPEHYAW